MINIQNPHPYPRYLSRHHQSMQRGRLETNFCLWVLEWEKKVFGSKVRLSNYLLKYHKENQSEVGIDRFIWNAITVQILEKHNELMSSNQKTQYSYSCHLNKLVSILLAMAYFLRINSTLTGFLLSQIIDCTGNMEFMFSVIPGYKSFERFLSSQDLSSGSICVGSLIWVAQLPLICMNAQENKDLADLWGIERRPPCPSLLHTCRVAIRRRLLRADRATMPCAMESLSVPGMLKAYLNLQMDWAVGKVCLTLYFNKLCSWLILQVQGTISCASCKTTITHMLVPVVVVFVCFLSSRILI